MRKRTLLGRPSHTTVAAYLSLFLVISGGAAYAAGQLGKNSVGGKQLKKNAVSTAKIKNEAVTGAKVKKGTLTGSNVQDGSLTGGDIQDGSLSGADINQGSLNSVRAANVIGIAITKDESCSPALPLPSGVTTKRTGTGSCRITFPSSVSACTATAAIHFRPTGKLELLLVTDRSTQVFSPEANVIGVETYEKEGLTNLPFDLILVC